MYIILEHDYVITKLIKINVRLMKLKRQFQFTCRLIKTPG